MSGFGQDPSPITAALQLEPTGVVRLGEPRGSRGLPAPFDSWWLESDLSVEDSFEDHLEALLSRLETRADAVRQVAREYEAGLSCYSAFGSYNPGLYLSRDHLKRVAALELGFDFDLYVFYADDPAEIPVGADAALEVTLHPHSAGGRQGPVYLWDPSIRYRPHLRLIEGNGEMLGVEWITGSRPIVAPGSSALVHARFLCEVDYTGLVPGARFEILEGPRVVGDGQVIAAVERSQHWPNSPA